jgi:retinol dehydrogenase 12
VKLKGKTPLKVRSDHAFPFYLFIIAGIEEELGVSNAELHIVDLTSFASVKQFVDSFEKDINRLDILVANAAVAPSVPRTTPDGWDER